MAFEVLHYYFSLIRYWWFRLYVWDTHAECSAAALHVTNGLAHLCKFLWGGDSLGWLAGLKTWHVKEVGRIVVFLCLWILDLQFKVSRLLAFLFFGDCLNSTFRWKMSLLLSPEVIDIRENLAQWDWKKTEVTVCNKLGLRECKILKLV